MLVPLPKDMVPKTERYETNKLITCNVKRFTALKTYPAIQSGFREAPGTGTAIVQVLTTYKR